MGISSKVIHHTDPDTQRMGIRVFLFAHKTDILMKETRPASDAKALERGKQL